jgi:hypothetical protein
MQVIISLLAMCSNLSPSTPTSLEHSRTRVNVTTLVILAAVDLGFTRPMDHSLKVTFPGDAPSDASQRARRFSTSLSTAQGYKGSPSPRRTLLISP